MPSPLLPLGRAGERPRPASAPRLAMGAVTLAALASAAWAAVIALTVSGPFSCALTSDDVAANRCAAVAGRFGDLSPAAVLLLLLPPAAGVALGWPGVLRGSPDRRAEWGRVVAGAVLVLVGLVGCALLWASLVGAAPAL